VCGLLNGKKALAFMLMCMMSAPTTYAQENTPVNPTNSGTPAVIQTMEPEYIDLTSGSKGDEVLRLQQRLAELGFFYTAEDGKFGANTKNAVKEFENYLRMLEQDEIDRWIEANKTPEPTATPEPTVSEAPAAEDESSAAGDGTVENQTEGNAAAGEPSETPAPTPEPTPAPTPETIADGTADAAIQEILFGDANALYRREAKSGDRGEDVLRIQRKLIYLNYLNDEPDYRFGVNTETALKAFQQAHDLNATGVADRATQEILFSNGAVRAEKPVYNQLYLGMSGDAVKAVQKQLRLLGFTNSKASGVFDEKTQNAVMLLETYLHELDMKEQGVVVVTVTSTPVPEEILDQQGRIDGDPESNPYEVAPGEEKISGTEATAEPSEAVQVDGERQSMNSAAPEEVPNNSIEPKETEMPEATEVSSSETPEPEQTAAPFSGIVPVNPNTNRKNQKEAFKPTGIVSARMQERLLEEDVPVYLQTVQRGSAGEQVKRIQRRLYSLGYLTANGVDGIYGDGTMKAVSAFQRRNKMAETGVADRNMQTVLFSEDAVKAIKPYQIKISTKEQRVYVYAHDDKDEYTIEVKKFICSTGLNDTPTPKGTFTNTGPGAKWHYFKKFECWAQYAYYINGDIMFHSVLYDEKDVSTLRKGSVNALGSKASHGCVRLKVEDAKWIYENCKAGTTVIVY